MRSCSRLTLSHSFATGQRMCVGFNFALQEIKIFMAKLIWRYRWLKEGDPDANYDPFFQLIRPMQVTSSTNLRRVMTLTMLFAHRNLYVRTMKREKYPSKSHSRMS